MTGRLARDRTSDAMKTSRRPVVLTCYNIGPPNIWNDPSANRLCIGHTSRLSNDDRFLRFDRGWFSQAGRKNWEAGRKIFRGELRTNPDRKLRSGFVRSSSTSPVRRRCSCRRFQSALEKELPAPRRMMFDEGFDLNSRSFLRCVFSRFFPT